METDDTFERGALGRQHRAEARAVSAARRERAAEDQTDAETRPELAEIHHDEAKLHARAAALQRQAVELQRQHLREHGER